MQTEQLTSWIEVNTGALKHNLNEVRTLVGPGIKIMAVVKADAYGHGAVGASRAFAEAGADYLGVTSLDEGLQLRKAGIDTPVLIFSPLLPSQTEIAVLHNLEFTICDLDVARTISEKAQEVGKPAQVHIKIDTGMGRLGVNISDCPDFVYRLLNLPGIEIKGIYTHFANAGAKNLSHAREQNSKFSELIALLKSKHMPLGLCHASNSAAILSLPDSRYDMVRPGTILYGQYPSRNIARKLNLKDTWCLKTRIIALRKLPADSPIGYGGEFTTRRPTLSAVIPVGYADGFTLVPESLARRANSPLRAIVAGILKHNSSPQVTIHGKRVPVIGRVSMQMCSVDATNIPDVKIGDEVIVPSRRVTTSSRIPRIYVE